jgi:uncharacterized protein (DUF1501 family)
VDTLTRRRFLIASGITGGAALVAGASAVSWEELHARAQRAPLTTGTPILVVVTLYGGNDGLNTVIPYGDPAYHDARPDLSYDEQDVRRLDDQLGLNPALVGFEKLWKSQRQAIVRGVGYPKPDLSHFRSMDIWQTASPDEPIDNGWVGRWLDATGDDPARAVNIGSVLPPLAVGAKTAAAALPLGVTPLLPTNLAHDAAGLGCQDYTDTPSQAAVRATFRAERRFSAIVGPALAGATATPTSTNPLADQLDLVAQCIKAGIPTTVYLVSLDSFDTHAAEKATQQALLGTLDSAVSAFLSDMANDPRGRGVVLLAYSEFGRRVAATASQGTDHGTAGPVFVAGLPVRGGFYGTQPSLTDLDNGDLKYDVDFRAIYGELVHKVLRTDPGRVLRTVPPELGFLSA